MLAQQETTELRQFTVKERAVTYARVSGDDTKNGGRNLQGQLDDCREYVNDENYILVAEFAEDDRGASGYEIDLPELNKIREMAHAGQFDVLVIRELDRLSRNLAKQLIVEEELTKAGVKIEYVLAKYDDTPEGRLNKHIRGTIAEYEREKIKERLQRGKEKASKAGKVLINVPPFGYDLLEGTLVPNDTEKEIVILIYQWYVVESMTLYGIATRLDEMGVIRQGKSQAARLKRNHNIGWTPDAVRRILTSETYIGTFYYGKKKIPVNVPAIVKPELFQLAQDRIDSNKRVRAKKKYNYLLGGMCQCGKCGNNYVGYANSYKSVIYPRYACSARRNPKIHSNGKCLAPIVKVDILDQMVWDWIKGFLDDPDRLHGYLHERNTKAEEFNRPILRQIEVAQKLIDEHQEKLTRLIDAYLEGLFSKEDIIDKKQRLKMTIEKLTTQQAALRKKLSGQMLTDKEIDDIVTLAKRLGKGVKWADSNFDDRRRLIKALNTQVILTPIDKKRLEVAISCILGNCELEYGETNVTIPNVTISTSLVLYL